MSSVFSSIAFLDSALPDHQTLRNGIAAGTEVITLDAARDGVVQITEALANRSNIKSIHIISHGRPASLQLGAIDLNLTNLKTYAKQLQRWWRSLADSGEILLYGCDVAAGEKGANFVQQLSQLTKAKIAASTSPIGSSAMGGDWQLYYTTGVIVAGLAIDPATRAAYQFVFGRTLYDGTSNFPFPAAATPGIGTPLPDGTQLAYGELPAALPFANGAFTPNTGIDTASVTAANNTTGYAGYTNYKYTPPSPPATPGTFTPVNATFPALNLTNGYSVSFRVAVTAENSGINDRAGFSIISISSDAQNGIELGFTNRNLGANGGIFAQNGGTATSVPPLFTRGVNAPVNISTPTDYKLVVQGTTYTLFAGPTAIPNLTNQPLQNYTAFNPATSQPALPFNPYSQPNFLFFGDATDQASASFTLGPISVNNFPVAVDDGSYSVVHDKVRSVSVAEGVLSNDTDANSGDARSAVVVTAPSNGTVTLNLTGDFTYTPKAGFVGTDTFTYNVSDGTDSSVQPATVTINVTNNNLPIVQPENYPTLHDQVLNVPFAKGVLANDSDVDGDVLTATKVTNPNNGTIAFNKDGSFIYTPNPGFVGLDSFTYTVSDGAATLPAIANISVTNNPPIVQPENYPTLHDQVLNVPFAKGVLAND
ncbi:DUF4347 domain-containing protein, partial [Microcoleus sp. herbarium5]|uniref:DUF4347 domain-containing protein n=1 Tax=Microcoleus sp. herbarium5 TaxID=3055434 RepID=UPI002FD23BD6